MSKYQCKACSGVYVDPARDGSRYFHSCAPIHNADYDAQFTIDDKGERVPKGPLNPEIPEMVEFPAKRDENVELKPDGKMQPKSDGVGKDTLPSVKG